MLGAMALRYIVLDFDGTCTQIDRAYEGYFADYRRIVEDVNQLAPGALAQPWAAAHDQVTAASPDAGWTLFEAPSTAPAAADPYILAFEVTALLRRRGAIRVAPADAHHRAYAANEAPWRAEAARVLAALVARGLRVGFISNSEPQGIEARLTALLAADPGLRTEIRVLGSAAKFKVRELPVGAAGPGAAHRARFEQLAGAVRAGGTVRPIYLRRGAYFEALCELWHQLGTAEFAIAQTLVCGDIWELDLAMPRALGAAVHLIRRAPPFSSYPYELAQLADPRDASDDLTGLIDHVDRLLAGA